MTPHGPRRSHTARMPAAADGRTSLSGRSPTYATAAGSGSTHQLQGARAKNAGSGFETPISSLMAITSGSMPSARSSARPLGGLVADDRHPVAARPQCRDGRAAHPGYRSPAWKPPYRRRTSGAGAASRGRPAARTRRMLLPRATTAPNAARNVIRGMPRTSAQVAQIRVSSMSVSPTSRQTQRPPAADGAVTRRRAAARDRPARTRRARSPAAPGCARC